MAEGDSLVRIARRLRPVMIGREIEEASAPNPRSPLKGKARRLPGRRVQSVQAKGKHLMIELDEGLTIHSHLGMNGSWRLDEGAGFGKPDRNAWLILGFEPGRVAQFGGPTLRLARTVELNVDPRLARLGPDILEPGFSVEDDARRILSSQEEIGVALLDQTLICGIGNIFKSEACFEAKIDPWRQVASISEEEATRLIGIARRQMLEAVETGRRPGRVYRRGGRSCPRCRTARISSRGQGDDNRTTYWCPRCQK